MQTSILNDHHTIMENCHWRAADRLIQLQKIDFKCFRSIEDEILHWMHQFNVVIRYSNFELSNKMTMNCIQLIWITWHWIVHTNCGFIKFQKTNRKKINSSKKCIQNELAFISIIHYIIIRFVLYSMSLKFAKAFFTNFKWKENHLMIQNISYHLFHVFIMYLFY